MKVLFLLQRYPGFGGIETVTRLLAQGFIDISGYDVAVFSTSRQEVPAQILISEKFKYLSSDAKGTELKKEFDSFLHKYNPDVIIYQDSYVDESYLLQDIPENIKIITCEHNTPDALETGLKHVTKCLPFTPYNIYRKLRLPFRLRSIWKRSKIHHRKMYDMCDRYVVLSESFIPILGHKYGVPHENIVTIPNPGPDGSPIKYQKRNLAVFIARLEHQKGVNYLIDIWEKVERQCDWELYIVGDGNQKGWLKKEIHHRGLKRVSLKGYQSDVGKYYGEASIHLMTSVFEGFGMTNVEAMSYRTIPFAFDSYAALRDVISDKKDGFIIPAYDIDSYAEAILDFIRMPEHEKESMREAAFNKCRQFAIGEIAMKWDNLLNELIRE